MTIAGLSVQWSLLTLAGSALCGVILNRAGAARLKSSARSASPAHSVLVVRRSLRRLSAVICVVLVVLGLSMARRLPVVLTESRAGRQMAGVLLLTVAATALCTSIAVRPAVTAYARARGLGLADFRRLRRQSYPALLVNGVLLLWPAVAALLLPAGLAVRAAVAGAGYLAVNPVATGAVAPALVRRRATADLPEQVAARLSVLARQAGLRPPAGLVLPGRAAGVANAYQSGFPPGRRCVAVTDYLLVETSPDQVDAVLAHELGHARNRDHLVRTLVANLGAACVAVALLGTQALAATAPGQSIGLPALAIVAALLASFSVVQALPRLAIRQEYAADDAAARLVGAAPLRSALVRLTELNALLAQTSPSWDRQVSHPGMARRIERLSSGTVPPPEGQDPRTAVP